MTFLGGISPAQTPTGTRSVVSSNLVGGCFHFSRKLGFALFWGEVWRLRHARAVRPCTALVRMCSRVFLGCLCLVLWCSVPSCSVVLGGAARRAAESPHEPCGGIFAPWSTGVVPGGRISPGRGWGSMGMFLVVMEGSRTCLRSILFRCDEGQTNEFTFYPTTSFVSYRWQAEGSFTGPARRTDRQGILSCGRHLHQEPTQTADQGSGRRYRCRSSCGSS